MLGDGDAYNPLHRPHASEQQAASAARDTTLLRRWLRRHRLWLFISALLTVCVPVVTVVDPLSLHVSLRSHSLLWAATATVRLPIDAVSPQRSIEPRTIHPRRADDNLSASIVALYAALPPLPELSSPSFDSVLAVRSLTRCLDAASSASGPPSLRRVAVVSSDDSAPSAVSLSLALRRSHWCVLVVGLEDAATFTSRVAAALDPFHQWSSELHDSLQLADSGAEEQARLAQRLIYVSAQALSTLPYALSGLRLGLQWPLQRARSVAYLFAMHAGADVLYDSEDGAPVVTSSDLPALYMSHAFATPSLRQRTLFRRTLPTLLNDTRSRRRTSNFSSVRALSADPSVYDVSAALMNPYPLLGHSRLWPRGFPTSQAERSLGPVERPPLLPDHQQSQHCLPAIQQFVPAQPSALDMDRYGEEWMARSPVQHNTQQPQQSQSASRRPGQRDEVRWSLPFDAYAPVNALSSVWLSSALSSLLLPLTVPPRVSDIWRSYIAETLLSYGRVNNRPFNLSHHSDSHRNADWRGPGWSNLLPADIEPCVVYLTATTLPVTRPERSNVVDLTEQPFADKAEWLIALLSTRQHGQPFDLLTRARRRIQPHLYGEVSQPHLLAELYADLYEAGVLGWDDVQVAIAWVTDALSIAAMRQQDNARQPRQQDDFTHPPLPAPQPTHFLPTLPHRQRGMVVCVNFNFAPADNSLWQLLRYYSRLHDQLAIVLPVSFGELSAHQQYWLTRLFPQVQLLQAAEEVEGRCQQYSLLRCLEWANSSGVLEGGDVQGVLYTADDLWFDFHEVLYPRPQQAGALPTFTDVSLSNTRLTYPLDEFWYPLPVMELNMSAPGDSISSWEWLNGHQGPYFAYLKHVWRHWPQQWRDLLSSVTGVQDSVVTNAVADLVYVPRSRQQLHTLLNVLRYTLYDIPQPAGCVFSEVLLTQLLHLSMLLSGVTPAILLPCCGAEYDHQYETLYFHPPGFERNVTAFYAQLHRYLTEPLSRPGLAALPTAHEARVRPVPLRVDGYRWERKDVTWMRRVLIEGDGDPVFLHPVKLTETAGGDVHEAYTASAERMLRRMDEARSERGKQ